MKLSKTIFYLISLYGEHGEHSVKDKKIFLFFFSFLNYLQIAVEFYVVRCKNACFLNTCEGLNSAYHQSGKRFSLANSPVIEILICNERKKEKGTEEVKRNKVSKKG